LVGAAALVGLLFGVEATDVATGLAIVVWGLVLVLTTGLGALIATKTPGNRISWLFYLAGVGMLITPLMGSLIPEIAPAEPTLWNYVALVYEHALVLATLFYPLLLLFYVFPTGRFLTKRWTWAGWFGVIMVPTLLVLATFAEEIGSAFAVEPNKWTIQNPIGFLPLAALEAAGAIWTVGLIVVAVGSVAAMTVRYRRATHVVRTQIKWLLYPGVIFAISFTLITTGTGDGNDLLFALLFVVPIALIPISITVAIMRYKLFEIDRIISRTVGYILVVAMLGFVYIVGAIWLPTQLLGEQAPIFVAGSTLVVAALFNPVRKRIVGWVDRRFYRSHYDAEQVVDEFADRLRDQLDVDQLTQAWVAAVTETMRPSAIGVWVQDQRADNKP
jgi:hypothetical protein